MLTTVWKLKNIAFFGGVLAMIVVLLSLKIYDAQAALVVQDVTQGEAIYIERCSACHGIEGNGQGPAAERLFIKPRDFTRDEYKIKSTQGDEFPSRDDLIAIIADGMPGTSMPAWDDELNEDEIGDVADYIQQSFGAMLELYALIGVRQAVVGCQGRDVSKLRLFGSQEFLTGRNVEEEVADSDDGAFCRGRLVTLEQLASGYLDAGPSGLVRGFRFEQKARDGADRG